MNSKANYKAKSRYEERLDDFLFDEIRDELNRHEEEFPDLIYVDDEPILIDKNINEV